MQINVREKYLIDIYNDVQKWLSTDNLEKYLFPQNVLLFPILHCFNLRLLFSVRLLYQKVTVSRTYLFVLYHIRGRKHEK